MLSVIRNNVWAFCKRPTPFAAHLPSPFFSPSASSGGVGRMSAEEEIFRLAYRPPTPPPSAARAALATKSQELKNAAGLPKNIVQRLRARLRHTPPRFSKAPLRGAAARGFSGVRGGREICKPRESLRHSFVNYFPANFIRGRGRTERTGVPQRVCGTKAAGGSMPPAAFLRHKCASE